MREISIYHAQAMEIQDSMEETRPTFSFDKLRCWGEVASRVLTSINWQPACAYNSTIFPDKETAAKIRWGEIKVGSEGNRLQGHQHTVIELYATAHISHGIAMAAVCMLRNRKWVARYVSVIGRAIKDPLQTLPGSALAIGLDTTVKDVLRKQEGTNRGQQWLYMYTDIDQLRQESQKQRWET